MKNLVILIGRCGKDPETRHLQDGTAVANWTLACSEKFKTKAGEHREETYWAKCSAYGRLAEIVAEYAQKGTMMYCEGKLQERSWDDKGGVKRYTTEIVVRDLRLLSPKQQGQQQAAPCQAPEMGDDSRVPF